MVAYWYVSDSLDRRTSLEKRLLLRFLSLEEVLSDAERAKARELYHKLSILPDISTFDVLKYLILYTKNFEKELQDERIEKRTESHAG